MKNIFNNLKNSVGKYFYNRKISKLRRQIKALNLQNVKTAGVILEADYKENLKLLKELRKHLPEDATIIATAYIHDNKKNNSYIGDKFFNYVKDEDFDFFMRPKSGSINDFIQKKFDILFVFAYNYYFAIELMTGLSKAGFKVGQSGVYEKNLDFYIDTKTKDLDVLINQIVNYLNSINMTDTKTPQKLSV